MAGCWWRLYAPAERMRDKRSDLARPQRASYCSNAMPVCQKTLGESQRERPEAGRGWRTRHRDPILIHAAKPTGVAVVDLVDCVPLAEVGGEPYRGVGFCAMLAAWGRSPIRVGNGSSMSSGRYSGRLKGRPAA